jgi:hypothetical protein
MVTNFLLHLSTLCITFMKPIYILSVSPIETKLVFWNRLTSKEGPQQTYIIPQGLICSVKLFREGCTSAPNHT